MSAPTRIHTLKRGDLAFYETIGSGLVPVKVRAIIRDGDEVVAAVRVTANRRAYNRGETLFLRAGAFLHARSAVRIGRTGSHIIGRTEFVPDDDAVVPR